MFRCRRLWHAIKIRCNSFLQSFIIRATYSQRKRDLVPLMEFSKFRPISSLCIFILLISPSTRPIHAQNRTFFMSASTTDHKQSHIKGTMEGSFANKERPLVPTYLQCQITSARSKPKFQVLVDFHHSPGRRQRPSGVLRGGGTGNGQTSPLRCPRRHRPANFARSS